MSSVFVISDDGREEREAKKAKRLVHGSSITMIFAPNWDEVVIGWSKKPIEKRGQVWKFACGEAEVQDVPDIETANSVAGQFTNCAKRECKNETGLDEDKGVFAIVQALNYIRHSNSKDVGPLQQWHFLALLKERLTLPTEPIESYEMGDPEYWRVVDVLRLPTPRNSIPRSRKVNPYHQIALARCIIEVREESRQVELNGEPICQEFKNLLLGIYDSGINIDTYERDVMSKIRSGEL